MASLLVLLSLSTSWMKCAAMFFFFLAKYPDMQLLAKVCMGVFHLLSDGQVATGYVPYCMFETCKQEQGVWYRRRRDSFVEGQIGGSKFKLAMARGDRGGGLLVWKMGQLTGDRGSTSTCPAGGNKSYTLCFIVCSLSGIYMLFNTLRLAPRSKADLIPPGLELSTLTLGI